MAYFAIRYMWLNLNFLKLLNYINFKPEFYKNRLKLTKIGILWFDWKFRVPNDSSFLTSNVNFKIRNFDSEAFWENLIRNWYHVRQYNLPVSFHTCPSTYTSFWPYFTTSTRIEFGRHSIKPIFRTRNIDLVNKIIPYLTIPD